MVEKSLAEKNLINQTVKAAMEKLSAMNLPVFPRVTKGNSPKLHQGRFALDIRTNSIRERVLRLGPGCPGHLNTIACGIWGQGLVVALAVLGCT